MSSSRAVIELASAAGKPTRPFEIGWETRSPTVRLAAPARFGGGTFDALWSILSSDERERAGRFVFRRDLELYVTAHGLLRETLSEFTGRREPAEWTICADPNGRPHVEGLPRIDISISHTSGMVGAAVLKDGRCGIDLEKLSETEPDVIASVLSAPELDALCTGSDRPAAFFRYWTLKESFSKAVGTGLGMPFDQVEFTPAGTIPRLEGLGPDVDTQGLSRAPTDWSFKTRVVDRGHALAIAWTMPGVLTDR